MEILYGVDPKSAIWNFFVALKAELEMVDSHDFSLDANETAQFDALFNQITYELFAKRSNNLYKAHNNNVTKMSL